MSLPAEFEVQNALDDWILASTRPGAEITESGFEKVKIQLFSLGLIRMEKLLRRGTGNSPPQPTLCWMLTEAGRRALGELLGEKRSESATSDTE